MSISQFEVDYGPQPYDRSQGGPLVFGGSLQDAEATSVHVEVTIRDAWGREVFREGVQARDKGGGLWELSLAWEPGNEVPDGDYGPFFKTTRTYPNRCPVITDEAICNGIVSCRNRRRGWHRGAGSGPCPPEWDLRQVSEQEDPGSQPPGDPSSTFGSVASPDQGPGF
ncbi:MAG: hypothetical protein ACOX9B_15035 [Candidatus Xenobium sp.]|jgi:hypothetical protein|nr:hypothetical protein [Burkholderiales bacterium]